MATWYETAGLPPVILVDGVHNMGELVFEVKLERFADLEAFLRAVADGWRNVLSDRTGERGVDEAERIRRCEKRIESLVAGMVSRDSDAAAIRELFGKKRRAIWPNEKAATFAKWTTREKREALEKAGVDVVGYCEMRRALLASA